MQLAVVIFFALIFNMLGAVVGKYMALANGLAPFVLLTALYLVVNFSRVIFWIVIGKKYKLNYIYPVLSINFLFSFILGIVLFGEDFRMSKIYGSIIIIIGVAILSLTKQKQEVAC